MLRHLKIENYAIIETIELDFNGGMTVLTGETGAGKSIIVDALSLLLGERASREMISSRAEEATVTGIFSIDNDQIKSVLDLNEIDYDEELIIYRSISKQNKNIVKINNQVSSLKILNDLAIYIADIHSQFDTNRLINPENYLSLIDNFRKDKIKLYLIDYQNKLENYKSEIKEYNQILKEKAETVKQLDLYKYQLNEIASMELKESEEEGISEQINVLENIDKINSKLEKTSASLNDEMLMDRLYEIKSDLESISATSKDFESIYERVNDAYYELEDINELISKKKASLNYDPDSFDLLNQRLNDLEKLQRKYKMNIKELLEYQTFLEKSIDKVENFDEIIKEKQASCKKAFSELLGEADKLTSFRKDIADKITKQIKETLHELVILHADFKIQFERIEPHDEFDLSAFKFDGLDNVDFLISTNKGEPLKSLAKTASGGEMSRVMLAFKTIFVRSQKISTIVFDEIDTGISGYIAKQIANKISEISKITQVISITHIPQVVATGTHHISVTKKITGNVTKISANYLTYDERITEIAKMISADKPTQASLESARELLISN